MLNEKLFKALMSCAELSGYAKSAEDIIKRPKEGDEEVMVMVRYGWIKGLIEKANATSDDVYLALDNQPTTKIDCTW